MKRYLLALLFFGCLKTAHSQLHVVNGETVKVTSADDLVLLDNLENNGSIERITLSGTSAQTVTGTGTINHLKLSKTALGNSATISSGMQSLTGTLDLTAGTLAAGGFLTLKSDVNGTARVVQHTSAGSVSGNVVVERFIPGSRKKQWRVLAFPYSNAIALNQISGIGITTTAGTQSMMIFNESADNGVYGNGTVRNAGYQSFSNMSDQIPAGKGVAAWLYGADNTANLTDGVNLASDLVISSYGQLNESVAEVVLTNPTITNDQQGWNLVANPYASPIDWNVVMTSSSAGNIASTLYRWDPQAADWTTYNSQTGSANGLGSRHIESGSAFFITSATKKADGGGVMTLTIPQMAKGVITENKHFARAPFLLDLPQERVGSSFVKLAGIRVKASGQGNPIPGEAYLDISREDATRGWDPKYDGLMIARTSGAAVYFDEEKDDDFSMHFDAPLPVGEKRYYPMTVTSPALGQTMLEMRAEGSWNPLNSVSLIDTKEGKTILMQGGMLSYTFQMPSLKEEGRFLLAVNHVAFEKDGGVPGRQIRLLGNPVTGDRIDLLLAHPTAKPRRWDLSGMNGAKVAEGSFAPSEGNIQYRLLAPAMCAAGVYVLRVEMDNGEVQTVQVVRKQ